MPPTGLPRPFRTGRRRRRSLGKVLRGLPEAGCDRCRRGCPPPIRRAASCSQHQEITFDHTARNARKAQTVPCPPGAAGGNITCCSGQWALNLGATYSAQARHLAHSYLGGAASVGGAPLGPLRHHSPCATRGSSSSSQRSSGSPSSTLLSRKERLEPSEPSRRARSGSVLHASAMVALSAHERRSRRSTRFPHASHLL